MVRLKRKDKVEEGASKSTTEMTRSGGALEQGVSYCTDTLSYQLAGDVLNLQ